MLSRLRTAEIAEDQKPVLRLFGALAARATGLRAGDKKVFVILFDDGAALPIEVERFDGEGWTVKVGDEDAVAGTFEEFVSAVGASDRMIRQAEDTVKMADRLDRVLRIFSELPGRFDFELPSWGDLIPKSTQLDADGIMTQVESALDQIKVLYEINPESRFFIGKIVPKRFPKEARDRIKKAAGDRAQSGKETGRVLFGKAPVEKGRVRVVLSTKLPQAGQLGVVKKDAEKGAAVLIRPLVSATELPVWPEICLIAALIVRAAVPNLATASDPLEAFLEAESFAVGSETWVDQALSFYDPAAFAGAEGKQAFLKAVQKKLPFDPSWRPRYLPVAGANRLLQAARMTITLIRTMA